VELILADNPGLMKAWKHALLNEKVILCLGTIVIRSTYKLYFVVKSYSRAAVDVIWSCAWYQHGERLLPCPEPDCDHYHILSKKVH
jgi:hypothetical protein